MRAVRLIIWSSMILAGFWAMRFVLPLLSVEQTMLQIRNTLPTSLSDECEVTLRKALWLAQNQKQLAADLEAESSKCLGGKHGGILSSASQMTKDNESTSPTVGVRVEDGIIAIKVTRFRHRTYDELKDALGPTCVKFVVLDLRGNEGGDTSVALAMLNAFASGAAHLIKFSGNSPPQVKRVAEMCPELRSARIVVVVDEESGSASELFTLGLKAARPNDVRIVGQRTFGKHEWQSVFPIGLGEAWVVAACPVS